MRTRWAGTLALVLPDIANPFFPAVACGVVDGAAARGLAVVGYDDITMAAAARPHL